MTFTIRVRSAKLFSQSNFSRIYSYVKIIGAGHKYRTKTDQTGSIQPIWEQTLTFPKNPPNMKLQIWIQHPNGDILAGEVLVDLCNFYQRQPYRIQQKTIGLVLKGKNTAQIKVELSFDLDGVDKDQVNKFKLQEIRPQYVQNHSNKNNRGLQIGTVIAQGNKKVLLNQMKPLKKNNYQYNGVHYIQDPYRNPAINNQLKGMIPKKQQQYYNLNDNRVQNNNFQREKQVSNNQAKNLFQVLGNMNNKKPANNGWDL